MHIIFRRAKHNRYSIPLLLAIIEKHLPGANLYLLDDIGKLKSFCELKPFAVICYSFMTPDLGEIVDEIKEIRDLFKNRFIIIAGGPHPTADPQGCIDIGFDAIIAGEAENTLPGFLEKLYSNGKMNDDDRIISGAHPVESIDDYLPFSEKLGIYGPIELSRGCFYNCSFCQTKRIFSAPVRHRSIESAVKGAKGIIKMGRDNIFFISPNSLSYRSNEKGLFEGEHLENLFISLKKIGIKTINFGTFPSEIRPEYITEKAMYLLKKYCSNKKISIGIQTASNSLLKKLKRGHTVEQAVNSARLAFQFGKIPICDFIFGFPEETEEDVNLTFDLILELIKKYEAFIHMHYYIPLPGTPLWGAKPKPLSKKTKEMFHKLKKWGRLDGWWEKQEIISEKILDWKDRALIKA